MKAVYIIIGVVMVGGIAYGVYAYLKSQKEVVPAAPANIPSNKKSPTGLVLGHASIGLGPATNINLLSNPQRARG